MKLKKNIYIFLKNYGNIIISVKYNINKMWKKIKLDFQFFFKYVQEVLVSHGLSLHEHVR